MLSSHTNFEWALIPTYLRNGLSRYTGNTRKVIFNWVMKIYDDIHESGRWQAAVKYTESKKVRWNFTQDTWTLSQYTESILDLAASSCIGGRFFCQNGQSRPESLNIHEQKLGYEWQEELAYMILIECGLRENSRRLNWFNWLPRCLCYDLRVDMQGSNRHVNRSVKRLVHVDSIMPLSISFRGVQTVTRVFTERKVSYKVAFVRLWQRRTLIYSHWARIQIYWWCPVH